jgi:hypothetical protein
MALTPQQMDEKMHEHFAFEARDNIEGVLATLTEDVEHDIVGWPFGPSHGRDGARKFYEATFHDLSESKVRCVKRLYGHNFMVDESIWTGRAPGTPFGLEGRNHPPWNSDCCTSWNFPTAATSNAKTCGWISPPLFDNCRRIDVTDTRKSGRPNQRPARAKNSSAGGSPAIEAGPYPYS